MLKNKKTSSKVLMVLFLLFLYLPIFYIVVFSFNDSRSLTSFSGFSLRWYQKMFADSAMLEAIIYTIIIAVLATAVSTVVGTITSIGLSYSRKFVRNMVEQINNLPVMNPEIVTAIGLLMLFSTLAINKGFGTLLIAHIMFCIPYVMLSVTPKLRQMDPNLVSAALDLGATPFRALIDIIVPQIAPGILSGALIAFTMSFDDFVISYFVTGNGVQNISILVYTMSKRINPSINALSTIIILLITVVLVVINLIPVIVNKKKKKAGSSPVSTSRPKLSKRIIAIVVACSLVIVIGLSIIAGSALNNSSADVIAKYGSDTMKLYICGEYLGEDVISNFEEQFGVDVIIEYFDSNEMMYTKLQVGDSYDVLVPSDYMIERLMNNGSLAELDLSLIPNISNLADQVTSLPFDPDNTYAVPYFWGSVGIVYNSTNVDPAVVEEEGWDILRNTDYAGQIYMYDSERDSFMVALKALGYSMNSENPDEIQEAADWLIELNQTMNPIYVTDEVIDGMITGTKDIAVVYSGDAAVILDENEEMQFYMPDQGTNIWYDCMIIPANAQNPLLAHEFINYMITYDAAYDNAETVGYSSSHAEVLADISGSGGYFEGNDAYLPRAGYELDESFKDSKFLQQTLGELWIKIKAS